ncbi:MAG: hypothetical protein NZ483_08560, partial [Verrucomicrobiae bacterium]|nr:hypothetical protein [Verrucomicrobiae bacterium]
MSVLAQSHQQFKEFLQQGDWDAAQSLWLDLAAQFPDQTELLLSLIKELADAQQPTLASNLAELLVPQLKTAGKIHEWLFALKLIANAKPTDKTLRTELPAAYRAAYAGDPRLDAILATAAFDQPGTQLPAAVTKTDTLLALTVGAHCRHKSWGVGVVKTFDTALLRLVVQFPHNPEHSMQLGYAAESLTPLPPDHIEVRKRTDLPGLRQLAQNDPLNLLRTVLVSFNRAARPDQIETALCPDVIPAADWKKWWDNVKKLAKRDPHFEFPTRKTDPVILRTAPVSQQDELLQAFRDSPSLVGRIAVVRDFLKKRDELPNADLLRQELYDGLHDALARFPNAKAADRLEAALLLEELIPTPPVPLIEEILRETRDLPALVEALSTPAQKKIAARLLQTNADQLFRHINQLPAKLLEEITSAAEPIAARLIQLVHNQTASVDLLVWLCRCLNRPNAPDWVDTVPRYALLQAILSAIENAPSRSASKRLRDLLLNEESLITDLLAEANDEMIRDFARQLLASTAFEELDRRSLMGRIVKEFPIVQELLVTRVVKQPPLIVSRASYERRRAELEEIVTKKLPALSKEIAQARSYGDL